MNMTILKRFGLAILACLMAWGSWAQNISETFWYFGNSPQGLQFDLNGRDVYLLNNQATPFGIGGSAVITGQFTGNLLFYTDGQQVIDAGHAQISAALQGNPVINVPVVVCPVPGIPGQYYIITNPGNSGVNEIRYTVVDANLPGNGTIAFPRGEIISPNNATGLMNPAEGMILIPSGDGQLFWLITQDRTSFEFRVTPIDNGGFGATVPYNFVSMSLPGTEAAHFAFNPDSLYIAVAPRTANRNIRLLDFDPLTGVLAFNRVILNTGFNDGAGESVYDVEWSPDGTKLYFSRFGSAATAGNVYQFNLAADTLAPTSILSSPVFRSFGLQQAMDGNIYHLYQATNGGPFRLGRINEPDSAASEVDYQAIAFGQNFGGRQFPVFAPAYDFNFTDLDFVFLGNCLGENTKFFPITNPIPQGYEWDFGDNSGSDAVAPIHTYADPQGYSVTLTVFINGIRKSITKPVNILDNTAQVDLGADTTICVNEILILDAGPGFVAYQWSTGEIGQQIQVDTAGTYWVQVIGPEGCPAYDEIVVTEYGVVRQVNNQWYFGEQAGIDFTGGATAITDANQMYSEEGCATVSDVNGDLLFYTNGSTVWNKDHLVMLNGDLIGGDSTSTQSAIIVPVPNETTLFYIFTTQEVYGTGTFQAKMSLVDMKRDFARGEVMVKDIPFVTNSTEKLTATSVTGAGWILTHEFGNNIFRANQVGGNGVSSTVFSPVGEVHEITEEIQASGAMKFAPGLNHLAVTLPRSSGSFLELFDFDNGTGVVSNSRLIDMAETGQVYGLEFSNDARRLYLTITGGSSRLIQYKLDSIDRPTAVADITASKFSGYPTGSNYGALQMGPDGTIYMAIDGSGVLGTITTPNGDNGAIGFSNNGFDLEGRISRLGLPNFAQDQGTAPLLPGIAVDIGCLGQPTRFSGVGRDNSIETFTWIFGDGTSVTGQDTTHVYAAPGTYSVQMILSNRCDVDTVIYTTVTINPLPVDPQVPSEAAICDADGLVLSALPADDPNYTYLWSTGETTREITVLQPAIITIQIFDLNGCASNIRTIFVADGRPFLELGPDITVCEGGTAPTLDAINTGASYQWQINGVDAGTGRFQSIDTSVAGLFSYTVAVTDPVTFCTARDTVVVTVNPRADITITITPTSGCGATDGEIEIEFNTVDNFTYELTGPMAFGPVNFDGPGTPPAITNLPSGNYRLTTTNTVTGCVRTDNLIVTDPITYDLQVNTSAACPGDGVLQFSFGGPVPASVEIIVTYQDGTEVLNGTFATPLADLTSLDPGQYQIYVREIGGLGCVEEEIVNIPRLNPDVPFTFEPIQSICGATGFVSVSDGSGGTASYSWTGPGIVGPSTGTSILVNQPGTYEVTSSGGGFCPRTESIEVQFNTLPVVDIVQTGDPCEGEILLTADVSGFTGTLTYLWSTGQNTPFITVTADGDYSVTVRDQVTGCTGFGGPENVNVEQLVEVAISATPDCEDNGAIFLEAIPNAIVEVTYSWTGPGGPLSSTSNFIRVTQEGFYTVTASNAAGTCQAQATFDAIIRPITDDDISLDPETTFCSLRPGDPGVTLDPGIFNTYEWRLLPGPAIIATTRTITVTQEGRYEVTLYNGFTCRKFVVTVTDECRPKIFAPNAFTPNGDGLNDEFYVIPNPYVRTFEIVIHNRWGEPIYKSNDINFRWNGRLNGTILPPGTYAYVMRFTSNIDGSFPPQEQYGSITLIR
jgi:gliding motility-associated-like protein